MSCPQCAELLKDKERLDWLENYVEEGGKGGLITNLIPNGRSKDIRPAIDAARAAIPGNGAGSAGKN